MEEVFLSFLLKVYIAQIECSDCRSFPRPFSIQISACLLKHHFYRGSHSKMASKEHCMCIKQKQNISSQSFLRSPSTLKSSFQFFGHGKYIAVSTFQDVPNGYNLWKHVRYETIREGSHRMYGPCRTS